jgi:aerotaxis receptor
MGRLITIARPVRTNLPISQREHPFPRGRSLISVTDPKGRITYCNAAFVELSGYECAELLGQPHNIIRHPDMPPEAFRDMWATISAGVPWTGIVKNRRKNGDHYWVRANATPMKDGDTVVGYLSVRTEPSRADVQQAEALYAAMREEAEAGRCVHTLQRGKVLRATLAGRLARLSSGLDGRVLALDAGAIAATLAAAQWSMPLAVAVGTLGALSAAYLGVRWVHGPIRRVLNDAHRLASGDLSQPVAWGGSGLVGELQEALQQLRVNVRAVVQDTRTEVGNVDAAATEIGTGSTELSARTESQASSLQQTAASMEQMAATVKHSAQSAADGARLARQTAELSARSHDAVRSLVATTADIAGSSQRVQAIVQVIEGIAFQTNILSLNAAVEAARAGETGRGFAVVAAEVRALAQRTAVAAKEIKALIAESTERVAEGIERSRDASDRMNQALTAIASVNDMLEGISTAASEQQLGIGQINEAVGQMDTITQRNAAMVEDFSAAARSLRSRVEAVSDSMRLFRLASGDAAVSLTSAVDLRRAAKAAL